MNRREDPLADRIKRIVAGLVAITSLLVLCGCAQPDGERYRVTATVAVNGTLYSGSSVQNFHCHEGGGIWGSMDVGQCIVAGEAVFVDMKSHGNLFVLFKGPSGDMTSAVRSMRGARYDGPGSSVPDRWNVPLADMPMLVTFRNPRDPISVEKVDPANLAQTFGPGVTLRALTIEKTRDPISRGKVYAALPWLKSIGYNQIDGKSIVSSNELHNILQKSDFISRE